MAPRRALAGMGAAWALYRLLGPSPAPRCPGVQTRPPTPPGETVLVGRHEFCVRRVGSSQAPPAVLIHGWAFDSLATWHRLLPRLAAGLRVIAVDLRGHGKSDRIRGRHEVEDMADDVAGVLDALGMGRASVAGYSLGGMVALALARRHPARVGRLVIAASAARPFRLPPPAAAGMFVASRALARLEPTLAPRLVHRYLSRTGAIPAEHTAWLWETLAGRDPELHHEAAFAMARFDGRPWLGEIGCPTRFLVTAADQLIPADRQRATAALVPGAEVVEIAGARHEAVFTHADDLAAGILDFILAGAADGSSPPA